MMYREDIEEMHKVLDLRNEKKKKINTDQNAIYFREGDIRRCSLGMNIRSESYGKGDSFRRPILVLKKLSADFCIAIPLSSKTKKGTWFCEYSLHGKIGTALLYQAKALHKNRFQRKIGELDERDFRNIKKKLSELLNLS